MNLKRTQQKRMRELQMVRMELIRSSFEHYSSFAELWQKLPNYMD